MQDNACLNLRDAILSSQTEKNLSLKTPCADEGVKQWLGHSICCWDGNWQHQIKTTCPHRVQAIGVSNFNPSNIPGRNPSMCALSVTHTQRYKWPLFVRVSDY